MLKETVLTDEDIAANVQKGNKEQFGLIMQRYEKKLFRYGRKFLSNKDNIEDVVQEVFIKTYQNIKSFDTTQKFSPWIYRIAHNTFINMMKKGFRNPLTMFDFDTLVAHPIYEDPTQKEEEYQNIKKMLDIGLEKLSANYKEILILYFLEEQSYKEISDILRVPIGTVGIRLKRAKDALKKVYDSLGMTYGEQ